MADYFRSQLSEAEFQFLSESTDDVLKDVHFSVYKIGPLCNGTRSYSFSHANCDLKAVKVLEGQGVKEGAYRSVAFGMLYSKGFDLMSSLFESSIRFEQFDEPTKMALETLLDFTKNKKNHQECLAKVLKKEPLELSETDTAVAVSEHLLSKLSPGTSYTIDYHLKNKQSCTCGCKTKIKFGSTGIGNKHVWHGYLDVVFKAQGEVSAGATSAKRPRRERDEESEASDEEELNSNPGGKNDVVNKELIHSTENQAAAQAIVFSIIQKNRHPDLDNFLIPFIAISNSNVVIFMYDAKYDILLRSDEMPIFLGESKILEFDTVITLWMVLHYKIFCSGIDIENLAVNIKDLKSGFSELVEPSAEYYELLKSCVSSFPPVKPERELIPRKLRAAMRSSILKTKNTPR